MRQLPTPNTPSHPPLPSPRNIGSPSYKQTISRLSRQPHLARTSSNSVLSRKQLSTSKSSKQHQIESKLRYARSPKNEPVQTSFCNSQTNPQSAMLGLPFEDSTQTIQRVMHYSRQKNNRGRRLGCQLRGSVEKASDVLSGASRQLKKSRADRGSEDYYLYWKSKAHEYLQTNMKLMEDNRKLTRQNEQLREQLQSAAKKNHPVADIPKAVRDDESVNQLRRLSKHYLGKIEAMEKELKKKEVVIVSYQQKLTELTRQLSGDAERVKLLGKMRQDIERLQNKLRQKNQENIRNGSMEKSQSNPYLSPAKLLAVSPQSSTVSRPFPP